MEYHMAMLCVYACVTGSLVNMEVANSALLMYLLMFRRCVCIV